MASDKISPLFETKRAKGRVVYRVFAATLFVAICLILVYRWIYIPKQGEDGRWVWFGLLGADLWFGFYWLISLALRWQPVYRFPNKDRLNSRYQKKLPGVDIFVCTADPIIEPPIMVMNTVLSVMTYDYPSKKIGVYLSDDGGSILTFYALLQASEFARFWIPYSKKFNVGPRSPAAYFVSTSPHHQLHGSDEFFAIKKLYEEMEDKIETAMKLGRIPEEAALKHKGFSLWDSQNFSKRDHDTFLQILVDGEDPNAIEDIDGCPLPTLVYLAREKRPQYPHNFKAGAMNALIRVSSKISNGEIILNLDCDMYSNNSLSVQEALCFFMDEENGHDIAFVQFPQSFDNITKNDLYGGLIRIGAVEFCGLDGFGGPMYIGSGCFYRRDALCGRKFSRDCKFEWSRDDHHKRQQSLMELEEETKALANCTFEQNTQWGNEIGLRYGFPVEDVITGLSIQCRGWKSVYYAPEREAFLGVAPITLAQTLVQHKRWSEGHLQIVLSKYSPVWYGNGKISLGLQLGYCYYNLWAANCLPTLYYSIFPSLCLLKGISLFPQMSSLWFIPFAYVIIVSYTYSLTEFIWYGGTIQGWWNEQRIWLYKRSTSYLFGFIDTILKTDLDFVVTAKVADEEVFRRYKKEMMEFGESSPMFTILATLAMLNLVCFCGVVKKVVMNGNSIRYYYEIMACQIVICVSLVLINWPLYEGLFFRKDKGKLPGSLLMGIGLKEWYGFVLLILLLSPQEIYGIRFVIDREECFSHDVKYEGDTVHVSFVVVKTDSSWQYSEDGVDLVVKGPSGDQIHDFREKVSDKFEFMARQKGVHQFCFTNKSPYHETIDFDVHVGHFSYYDEHAKDEHFKPLLDQIWKLEEALYNIQFEQHWLEAQTDRQAIVNESMSRRALHKVLYESAALIGASVLQVYLLRRLFERKLGTSRV
ncbi:cellulose synthase-like protein E1 isoform X2 [Mercurialis annua]|uniref:cellulose synthase-like protein E1 isoform X2 n=2 Tax=Mercurialis annua TaxID=3986 RepID=UPI00215FD104|nr:cellulose synthase-like protein E1 isoform X2 [Mercurialis annua]